MLKINPAKRISYFSFGYIPSGRIVRDIYRRLVGVPNLAKRVQALSIVEALELKEDESCVDIGCGSGYITIELAKVCREAVGIDINPSIANNVVPDSLQGKLRYVVQDARSIPLTSCSVDVVLCSEVLMTIPNPSEFLAEVHRVLKPGGRIVVVSGIGHPAIKSAYQNNGALLRLAKKLYPESVPASYDAYVSVLTHSFNTSFEFPEPDYYPDLITKNSFNVTRTSYAPSGLAYGFISWLQFFQFIRKGTTITNFGFLSFMLASVLNQFKTDGSGGQIVQAEKCE
jgi:ubiquinone/menaquinone biosynthesis C-methylase UbiE